MNSKSMLFSALLCAGVGSCTSVAPPPPPAPNEDPHAAWARVLDVHVNDQGRINFPALRADHKDLDTYVAWVAVVSPAKKPELFPRKEDRIAFYINSYNALAMYNHVKTGTLPSSTATFFAFHKLMIGGEEMSLQGYENDVIRKQGEPRVHFALNCIVRDCPRLPRVPFQPDKLEQQLESATTEFMNATRHVSVVVAEKKVKHSKILEWYRDDFVAAAPSVLDYINRYRVEKIPAGFELESVDYDFELNTW
jgi:hypothetical protein